MLKFNGREDGFAIFTLVCWIVWTILDWAQNPLFCLPWERQYDGLTVVVAVLSCLSFALFVSRDWLVSLGNH